MLSLLIQGMYEHVEYERNGSRRCVADNRPAMHVSVGETVKVTAVCPRGVWVKNRIKWSHTKTLLPKVC